MQINATGAGRGQNAGQMKGNLEASNALSSMNVKGCGTGVHVMIKTVYAIAIAAIVAAGFVAFPSLSLQVLASSPVAGAKGDRADIRPLGTDCSENAWPYFEAACLRDARHPLQEPAQVRIISTDSLSDATAVR